MSNTKPSKTTKAVRTAVSMAAIDAYVDKNIVSPKETVNASTNRVAWGDGNKYPDYLLDLYNTVPTLRSIINGNIDYIVGDDIAIAQLQEYGRNIVNRAGHTIMEQVRDIAKDKEIYGGYALQIIRNSLGEVAEIYHIDMRYLRMNKDCNVFWYCEKWGSSSQTVLRYPAFMPNLEWSRLNDEERDLHSSSILFVKDVNTQTYPAPMYAASIKSCEIERLIDDFHISALSNQFASSAIVNFNNGVPDDDIQKEIERKFNEKFSGSRNAGRVILSWNPNKESATDIQEFKVEDFGARYDALSKHSRQQIFSAFRAIPLLFGLTAEANTGFSVDEFEQSFKLYNRTQIRPIQRMIADTYDKIYGQPGVLAIKPFTLDGDTENIVK